MNLLKYGFFIGAVISLFSCSTPQNDAANIPQPTETVVNINNEDGEENTLNRKLWIERMHLTAPGKNWRQIERKNSAVKIQKNGINRDNGLVTLSDSLTTGYWAERGSSNQAGSVIAITYLKEMDAIFTVSSGGTIWKGDREGSKWEVVNESYKFDNRTIFFVKNEDESNRMIATIASIPHYSDDMGLTWIAADGITSDGDFWSKTANFETAELADGSTRIYCLANKSFNSNILLYYSDDLGENYSLIEDLGVTEFKYVGFCKPHHSNDILIATTTPPNNLKIDIINHETATVELYKFVDVDVPHNSSRVVLIGNYLGQDSILYALQNHNTVVRSSDAGATWNSLADIEKQPWEVGFYVSPSDAEQVYYGEVEALKIQGNKFEPVNFWYEYYDNVPSKLHADIMSFEEFETPSGEPFLLIGNHGGMSISYDYLKTTQNIGMEGLNVAEYYDVRTDPLDPNYVYAGSQDQGFQRTNIMQDSDSSVPFDQIISGDYGHITFSRFGQGMWTVYPGGSISYLSKPQTGGFIDNYTIDSPDESNWLTPMTDIPNSSKNEILVAGGSIFGEPGSHIIKLEYFAGIKAEQFDFDFTANSGGGFITSIEVSPIDQNIIYVTTSSSDFFVSRDGGQTFNSGYNSINNGHYLYSTSIYASAINENEVWVAGSGYDNDAVLYSDDYGANFTLFTDGLPSTLVFEMTANTDETMFFAATEAGPYVYLTETGKWEDLSQGNAPVNTYWSVEYIEELDLARFGSYGRGIWDFDFRDPDVNVSTTDLVEHTFAKIYPNPVVDLLNIESLDSASDKITIELFNTNGQLMKSYTSNNIDGSIDFTGFAPGLYTLTIFDGNRIQREKLIKQ